MEHIRRRHKNALMNLVRSNLDDLRAVALMLLTSIRAFEEGGKKLENIKKFADEVVVVAENLKGEVWMFGEPIENIVDSDPDTVGPDAAGLDTVDDDYHSRVVKALKKEMAPPSVEAEEISLDEPSNEVFAGDEVVNAIFGNDEGIAKRMAEARKKLGEPTEQIIQNSNLANQTPREREKLIEGFYYSALDFICANLAEQQNLTTQETKNLYLAKKDVNGIPFEKIQRLVMKEADRRVEAFNR
jgi:hypothetical protein